MSSSITYSILNFFSEPLNQIFSGDGFFRFAIVAILVFIFTAILHIKKRINLFNDKTDAIFTIFSPLISLLPVGILYLILFIFNFDLENFESSLIDLYSITLLFLVFCSFRYAKLCNPNNLFGFCFSCFGRLFSVVSILSIAFGLILYAIPSREGRNEFEMDYIFFKRFAVLGACYSAFTWCIMQLTKKKEWGNTKDWLNLEFIFGSYAD